MEIDTTIPIVMIVFSGTVILVWVYSTAVVHDWDITSKLLKEESNVSITVSGHFFLSATPFGLFLRVFPNVWTGRLHL